MLPLAGSLFFCKLLLDPPILQAMISFFQKLFRRKKTQTVRKRRDPAPREGMLDLGIDRAPETRPAQPDSDVHQLMIEATAIRKKEGYAQAISFLKDLAEKYLADGNTALVTCMNKLIPYMKREKDTSFEETRRYLAGVIAAIPPREAYFRNLHLTMADLLAGHDPESALAYLKEHTRTDQPDWVDFDLLIMAAEIHIDRREEQEAAAELDRAEALLDPKLDRFLYIKQLRKWHRTRAQIARLHPGKTGAADYLFHRFLEFALDMARALDPMQIQLFHQRKDLYYKQERGFEHTEVFRQAVEELGLAERQEKMIRQLYGFVFEEMPLLLKVSEKQLHFRPGDPESLVELQEKKNYASKPFTEMPLIEDHLRQWIKNYL